MDYIPGYRPATPVTGPAHGPGFKMVATLVSFGLSGMMVSYLVRHAVPFNTHALLLTGIAVVLMSWHSMLHSTVTIDHRGIRQGGWPLRQVTWDDVRGAKLIGAVASGWLLPPRLVVRTGTAFYTFNGGTPTLLKEFAQIAGAYEMKP